MTRIGLTFWGIIRHGLLQRQVGFWKKPKTREKREWELWPRLAAAKLPRPWRMVGHSLSGCFAEQKTICLIHNRWTSSQSWDIVSVGVPPSWLQLGIHRHQWWEAKPLMAWFPWAQSHPLASISATSMLKSTERLIPVGNLHRRADWAQIWAGKWSARQEVEKACRDFEISRREIFLRNRFRVQESHVRYIIFYLQVWVRTESQWSLFSWW